MPKILVCGRGGSGKSTLVALLAGWLGEDGKALVVDADESNLGLSTMLGVAPPGRTLMDHLGGKPAVREKLMAAIQGQKNEDVRLFAEEISLDTVPSECVSWSGGIGLLQVGKIEHAMEGCACPMGAVVRDFLNRLVVAPGEWVLVDTEAGVEHFGRGVLEGVDRVVMVVDPSRDAVVLAEKAATLAKEARRDFSAVLNKVSGETESVLREMLASKGIEIEGVLAHSPALARAGLRGLPLNTALLRPELVQLRAGLGGVLASE
ncbi:MAG: nitrogenase reductase [Clostridia bacterium]|nr:nitrogenase reductase [Clostridia bacterium]MDH7573959.1 nitrogenase reductase [Clostridia bacterium]